MQIGLCISLIPSSNYAVGAERKYNEMHGLSACASIPQGCERKDCSIISSKEGSTYINTFFFSSTLARRWKKLRMIKYASILLSPRYGSFVCLFFFCCLLLLFLNAFKFSNGETLFNLASFISKGKAKRTLAFHAVRGGKMQITSIILFCFTIFLFVQEEHK